MTICKMIQDLVASYLESAKDREFREQTARTKGLDTNTNWGAIIEFNAEQERKDLATQLGLDQNATWRDVVQANDQNIQSMSPWRK